MTLEAVLSFVGGVAPTHVLRARGVSRWEIDRGVDEGRALRIRRGVLALPGAPTDFVTAVDEHARLTCISAAVHYGLWRILDPAQVHLCRPEEESVAVVECALQRHDVRGSLEARLQGRRNGKARAALAKVECTADSAIEVVARLLLRGAGLDARPQVQIQGVGRVDFLVEGFLIVEIDGAAYHSDRQAFRRDRRRDNAAVIEGYTVLRFTFEDVVLHPERLLAVVVQALGVRPIR